MGRELRMVPAGWEHPKRERFDVVTLRNEESYHPLYDQSAQDAWEEWESEYRAWLDGGFAKCCEEHPDLGYDESEPYRSFCEWHGEPPRPSYYRPPWDDSERTWFQVYETEGTPVTPPFATRGELIDYLITHGDFWHQKRWKRAERHVAALERFVQSLKEACDARTESTDRTGDQDRGPHHADRNADQQGACGPGDRRPE